MKNTFHLQFGFARVGIVVTAFAAFLACGSGKTADASGIAAAGAAPANSGTLKLALKFVEFTGKDGKTVITQDQVNRVITGVNALYSQCNIQFQLDSFQPADPAHYNLDYNTGNMDSMDKIRAPFDSEKDLVVVNTGSWDHSAMGPANAWTAMPGQAPSGAILEGPVADNSNIVAHELGHYLNLDHVSDESNMMNPIIYTDSTKVTSSQCDEMRRTAVSVRAQALR